MSKIYSLVEDAANGVDNILGGVVGSNNYGFLFKNEELLLNGVKFIGGGRIYPLGSMKDFAIDLDTHEVIDLDHYVSNNEGHTQDINIISSLKTLIPDMNFYDPRVYDDMFDAWVFVRIPEGHMFPASVYYGPTRLALGRWDFKVLDNSNNANDFEKLVNFNPNNLSFNERRELVIALELALTKVSKSYFLGIFGHDVGYRVLALQEGGSICLMLPVSAKLEFLLSLYGYEFKNNKIIKKKSKK